MHKEPATIVSLEGRDIPPEVQQETYDYWAEKEARNGDYLLWSARDGEKFPAIAAWLHDFSIGGTILLHWGW
jgi:hypothetical protein